MTKSIKKLLLEHNQYEHSRYTRIMHSTCEHVINCHNNTIFDIDIYNRYLTNLDTLVIKMNNIFDDRNEFINNHNFINTDCNIYSLFDEHLSSESKKILSKYDYLNIHNILNIDIEHYDTIKNELLKTSNEIGFRNVNDACDLLFGQNFCDLFIGHDHLSIIFNIISKTFVPLSFKYIETNSTKFDIRCSYNNSKYDVLLDNYFKIDIYVSKSLLTFDGYFISDPINVFTKSCKYYNECIYFNQKKINKLSDVSDNFINNYVKNLSIGEMLCYDYNSIYKKMELHYQKYKKITKMSFKNLFYEFTNEKSTLLDKYVIIKLLLLDNSDHNNNIAGILFGLTKDIKCNSERVSNIIFKNLNFLSQKKLRNSSVNLNNELNNLKNISFDNIDIKKQILFSKKMPPHIQQIALEKAEEMKLGTGDYQKQKMYLDVLLNYPWEINDDNKFIDEVNLEKSNKILNNISDTLNNKIYGHEKCKSVILELVGKWLSNSSSSGHVLGLYGPPGVGKTIIAKTIGDALDIPFTQINLGGMDDKCILNGHSYTYNSSQHGLIIRKIIEAGSSRCIIYFDELDKTCTKHGINEIYNILIHLTDPNTNSQYSDAFLTDITFDLSKILFIFSYNEPDKIDKILLDRFEQIEVKPYTLQDKLLITRKFLLDEITKNIGLKNDYINLNDDNVEYIIENYTFEAGVRELKRKIESLYLKINLDTILGKNILDKHNKIIINNDTIIHYLGKSISNIKKIHSIESVGIINGLYATNYGQGGILPILVYLNHTGKNFDLKMTGCQGKIMKESITFSLTIAMNIVKKEYLDKFLNINPYGFHVHTPDAASPKDGPSAGVAFTIAFISRILNKKIKNDVAVTGEIDMNGNILGVGGLEYKLKGAQKAGIKTIFIPSENKDELRNILEKDKTIGCMCVHTVSNIYNIFEHIICDTEHFIPNKYLIT